METFNFTERRLSKEQQEAFVLGYEAKRQEVKSMGWIAARDSFNWANDNIKSYSNLGYAYASGEMEALLDTK